MHHLLLFVLFVNTFFLGRERNFSGELIYGFVSCMWLLQPPGPIKLVKGITYCFSSTLVMCGLVALKQLKEINKSHKYVYVPFGIRFIFENVLQQSICYLFLPTEKQIRSKNDQKSSSMFFFWFLGFYCESLLNRKL